MENVTWRTLRKGDVIERKGRMYEILATHLDGLDERQEFAMRGQDGKTIFGAPKDLDASVTLVSRPPTEHVAVAEVTGVEPAAVAEVLARIQLGATRIAERLGDGSWSCPNAGELDDDPAALAAHLLFFHGGAPEHPALDSLHGRWIDERQSGVTVEHTHDRITVE